MVPPCEPTEGETWCSSPSLVHHALSPEAEDSEGLRDREALVPRSLPKGAQASEEGRSRCHMRGAGTRRVQSLGHIGCV